MQKMRSASQVNIRRRKDHKGRPLWSARLGTGPLPPPEWWDGSLKGKITFPEWRLFREYWCSVTETQLSFAQKLLCRNVMATWLVLNVHKLARDVIVALEQWARGSDEDDASDDAAHPAALGAK